MYVPSKLATAGVRVLALRRFPVMENELQEKADTAVDSRAVQGARVQDLGFGSRGVRAFKLFPYNLFNYSCSRIFPEALFLGQEH